jgi:ABC-type phosphate/phosphonate transport system substrate-binding protein
MSKFVYAFLFLTVLLFSKNQLNLGYYDNSFQGMSKEGVMIANNIYMNEIVKDLNYSLNSKVYDDILDMVKDAENKKLDYFTATGLDFVMHFDINLLSDGFTQGYEDGSKEVFIIVVLKNSSIKSVSDLYKKKIAVQKNDVIAQLYIENKVFEKHHKTSAHFHFYPTKQRALLKLFFGKVDAAVVSNKTFELITELNPQIGKKTKILETTNIAAKNFGFLHKSLDPKSRKIIITKVQALHKTVRGKQILAIFKTDAVVKSKLQDLKIFKKIYKKNTEIKLKKGN